MPRLRFALFPTLEAKMALARTVEEAGPAPDDRELIPLVVGGRGRRGDDGSERNGGGASEGLEDLAHARGLARSLLSNAARTDRLWPEWGSPSH